MAVTAARPKQSLAPARAASAARDLGRLARRRGDIRRLLPTDFRADHLGLCLGRAAAGRRPCRAHGAAGLGLHRRDRAAALGHHQHRDAGHRVRHRARGAGRLLRRPQHDAERYAGAAGRALHHRRLALDQLADLGADAGDHRRARRVRRHLGHRFPLDRLLRQAALRGHRGNRREPGRSRPRHRRQRRAGHRLWRRAAGDAGFRRHLGVPLGHQYPRVDGGRPGRRRRHRPTAQRRHHHAGLDAGFRSFCW